MPKIVYTKTDEAPHSRRIRCYRSSGIHSVIRDHVRAARHFVGGSNLGELSRGTDNRSKTERRAYRTGRVGQDAGSQHHQAPNISASIPQLQAAIKELKEDGYNVPDFPEEPRTEAERAIRARYAKVLGSAVNPVLREGNSDRRVAAPVKAFAKKHPHSMGKWTADSRSHVAHMDAGDFYSSERSHVMSQAGDVRIELVSPSGETTLLKDKVSLTVGEVIDGAVMSCQALRAFLAREIEDAKAKDVLLSLHLKATMMKVSDPIIFGHAVSTFYSDVFEKHAAAFDEVGVEPNNGLGDVYTKIKKLPAAQQTAIEADINAVYERRPRLAMVDSDRGITNLHVPSDVIIDASMPAAIRASGKMWGPDGQLHEMKAIIPDRSYARVYQETIAFLQGKRCLRCRDHGKRCERRTDGPKGRRVWFAR